MKILFFNLPFKFKISRTSRWPEMTKSGTLYYPYWLAYAAGFAEKNGFEVGLKDAIAKGWDSDRSVEEILLFKPDILVVEITTPTVNDDLNFLDLLEKNGFDGKIIVTGTHATVFPKQILEQSQSVDFAAFGEYDYTICDLAKNLESPEKVLGIAYKKDGKAVINGRRSYIVNLDELPFVSGVYKKFLDINNYGYSLALKPMVQIFTSRGCVYKCVFCSYPQTMEGRAYRTRSPENIVEELEYIKKELPQVKEVFIEDDTFTIDPERVIGICDLIIKKNIKIRWSANVRAHVSYEVLKKMKEAGCRLSVVGYESGNQRVLDNAKKGILIKQSLDFARNTKKLGIKVFGCFIIGLPGETKETIRDTFDLARKIMPDMVFFQQAVPFPGTEFYNWCKENGYLRTEDFSLWLDKNGQLDFLIDYPDLNHGEIEKIRDKLMMKFYFSPRYFWRTFIRNKDFDEMKRVARSGFKYINFLFRKYARL